LWAPACPSDNLNDGSLFSAFGSSTAGFGRLAYSRDRRRTPDSISMTAIVTTHTRSFATALDAWPNLMLVNTIFIDITISVYVYFTFYRMRIDVLSPRCPWVPGCQFLEGGVGRDEADRGRVSG
jgi:hypothetical protein